jgi:hypothetical protein
MYFCTRMKSSIYSNYPVFHEHDVMTMSVLFGHITNNAVSHSIEFFLDTFSKIARTYFPFNRLPYLLYSLGKIIEYRFSPALTTFAANVIAN